MTSLMRLMAEEAICDCEAPSATGGSISTVIIEAEELATGMAEWLRRVLAVGGIVLQIYASLKAKAREQRILRDRCMMNDHLVPARYYLQAERRRIRAAYDRYVIAGAVAALYRTHKPLGFHHRN